MRVYGNILVKTADEVCVESGATHAERTARREQEIEALKEALKILEETDFGF